MTTRRDWHDLPDGVRRAVEHRTGTVREAESPAGGRNSELAATLSTDSGRVFCKGVTTGSSLAVMHRNEIAVSPVLPERLAPRLLWHLDVDGWLLLGFEYVSGYHANLSPGSPDLPAVAEAVQEIRQVPAPSGRPMAAQWARALKPELESPPPADTDPWSVANADRLVAWASRAPDHMDGDSLVHSDLNPANFLVAKRAWVIDWAWWRTGAAWIDPAYLVIRLIAEGHDAGAAEKWALQFDSFAAAPPDALTAYSASVLRLWERRFANTPATNAARAWTQYRVHQ
ncbi:phosphotransferase [Actinocrispum wychmicini]|uniref:Uncharacterized protein n=1 Tax=Actinocrispum wychmicini TaxID=1213861 RepID=A0A4R2JWV5_9PSEU|nr:phosphotransferase [Actinocrispum wychmicini]TCO64963.1 hypothetical protein EV192_101747 [Actinocrispum wychmicini]